ncbi:gliding motility-associated C-terminal domain-containing protein [Flavobacterium sp. MR2016-29]|uniref:T9SS type B sorting domain-containing protein n=1 Tax=Flavobacterium sp. MR2016-29 TaxID=2783795 RepID=UPI00188CE6D4|nr:gliding motility-associated C-terminal domain-containing protein [Flavobacterium sp. MR2016-29]MBF4492988.1 gliding motility-associated C-terminal domain-containing protein [Flavobacterium sp. MR2016-29]
MKKKTNYWSKISIENLPIKKYMILAMLALLFPLVSFSQTVYTFTSAGATGRFGPTQSQVTTAYTATTLAGAVTVNTQGYQEWVVPVTGKYSIQAVGASGGQQSTNEFGTGADIYGEFSLTAGTVLKIAVGQYGLNGTDWEGSGGGGGSFVVLLTGNSPLLVAAGGAGSDGAGNYNVRLHPGGTSIFGDPSIQGTTTANGAIASSAGGGFNLNGEDGNVSTGGQSFLNGAIGGDCRYGQLLSHGGFGGGGAGDYYTCGGAGGGYQGGNTFGSYDASTGPQAAYSYNSGSNQINNSGIDGATDTALKMNGQVIITSLYSASISQTANVLCSGDLTGALSVAVDGSTGPYTYAWSPNVSTTDTASNLGVGTYNVTITDANSIPTTASFTIIATDNVKPTAIAKNITVQLDVNGSVTVNATQLNNGSTDNCGISSYAIASGSVGTVCDMVNEGSDLTLTAASSSVFTKVDFASYGTPSGSCGNYALGFCNSFYSVPNAESFLLGQSSATITADNLTFLDPCGGTPKRLAIQASYGPVSGSETSSITYSCTDLGTHNVVLFVTDNNGNVSTVNATITVEDIEIPVIASNGDQNVNVDANSCGATVVVSASATDNCTVGTPTGARNDAKLLTDVYPVGTTTITWDVTDANGNAAAPVTQIITVTDNEIPVIASNGDQNVNVDANSCGATVVVSASATDNCTVGTPTGARNDAKLLTDVYPVGTTTITWDVTDANGNAAAPVTQTITVTDNEIPVIASNGDQTVNTDSGNCGAMVSVSATATDNCTVATPTGARNDAKLLTDVYPVGTTTITWDVTDANGNAAVPVTQTITVTDNEIPVIASNGDQTVNTDAGNCGAMVSVSATATDNCTVATPTGARNDAKLLTDVYPVGTTTITWDVTDANGNAAVPVTQTITVTDNEIPVIASNGDQNVNVDANSCGATVVVSATATDNCTVGTPSGVRNDAKLLTDVYPVGTTTITWDVTDANGNAAAQVTQTITVTDNEVPVIVSNGDQSVNIDANSCGATVVVSASATDNCTVGTPAGARNDAKLLTDVYPVGTTTITWDVTDANGNAAAPVTQTITVIDNEIPVIASNGDQTVNSDAGICGAVVSVSATATDNCTVGNPTGARNDAKLLTDVYPLGTTTITWNVTDANGNAAAPVTQTVTVTDNVLPTVIAKDFTAQLDTTGNATILVSNIDNGSTDNCGINTIELDKTSFTCANVGANTVTLKVTDIHGNVASAQATVTVEDKIAPAVLTKDIIVQLNASGNVSILASDVNNNSSDNCAITTLTVSPNTFTCANIGNNTVTLTATDASGNTSSATAIVNVENKIAPTVLVKNASVQLNASGSVTITASDVDNSSTASCGTLTLSVSPSTFTCANVGANTVTLTATDANGNTSSRTSTVTVQDKVLPTVLTKNLTVQLDAAGNVSITAAQINNGSSDNCGIATVTVIPSTFSCNNVGANQVTLRVTDVNGNIATGTATVTVQDIILPTVKTNNISVELDDAGNASITANQINNGSSDNCGIATVTLSKLSFNCTNTGVNTVVLTVTDKNGNKATASATVTVKNSFGDNDNDGILDNCDVDDDNDGILDTSDNCPITANPYQEDRNNNGLGDACDKDQMNISEAFTPNGDGINDTWVISNIENYPSSVVRVFNRWGAEVFTARNYQNDWDGHSKGSNSTLPAASSYFYQIDLDGNGSIDKQGWIYINR